MTPPLLVRLIDNLRVAGALLAAGPWPELEQAAKAYKPHRVAELARRNYAAHSTHPAVQATAAAVGDGAGLPGLLAGAAAGHWPPGVGEHLADFAAASEAETFWATTQPAWAQAEADLTGALAGVGLPAFLETLFGPLPGTVVVYPNLLYPGRQALAFAAGDELIVAQPPPPAWGTSPPWRYHERPDEVLAVLAATAAEALFQIRLPAEHAALRAQATPFALAAAVLFLRQAIDPAAGDQFLVMEKKARRLPQLPYVVAALEAAVERGPAGLGDYVGELFEGTRHDWNPTTDDGRRTTDC